MEFSSPWVLITQGNAGTVNDDTVLDLSTGGVSDDGNRIAFSSWSSNGFGLATRNCSYDWIYVRDVATAQLTIAVKGFDGKPYCGYESNPLISGNGNFVIFRGSALPYPQSTMQRSGIWRTPINSSYVPVSAKGLEFSLDGGGTLKQGEVFIGTRGRALADTDGNSIVFTMSQVENGPDGIAKRYESTLFSNPMLRTDQGARTVANQDYTVYHGDSALDYNSFDVSSNGVSIVYSEISSSGRNYKSWDMLARKDTGDLFETERKLQPNTKPLVCGISSDGRYVLVRHEYNVPLDPINRGQGFQKLTGQLSRYDRNNKTYTYVAVAEEEGRSNDADCDAFTNGGLSRQMSKDANRVAWRSNGYFFVRDIAAQRTLKIKLASTVYKWTLSGDGRSIVFASDVAPDGKIYYNKSGGRVSQIYRYGPINLNDFGAEFTLSDFEKKLLSH